MPANESSPGESRPEVWGQVPQRNIHFTGREDQLEQLRELVRARPTAVLPAALYGKGGVGKTQIAVEYVYRNLADYDLVWWIPSEFPDNVRATLSQLAPHLGVPVSQNETVDLVIQALRVGRPYARWLLVFDNADDPADLVNSYPSDGPGHVLITSRNFDWEGVAPTITVPEFSPKESRDFLHRRLPSLGDEQADALAGELGHLPLALEQAGSMQAQTGMPSEEYLEVLRTKAGELMAEGKPVEYPVPLAATWSVSLESLRDKSEPAVELLELLAFFGPEALPRSVLSVGPGVVEGDLGETLSSPLRFNRAVGLLRRYSFIDVDVERRTVQMHRLFQSFTREDASADSRATSLKNVRRLLANALADPRSPDAPADWPLFASVLPHLEPSEALRHPEEPTTRHLLQAAVRYLHSAGDPLASERLARRVLRRWKDAPEVPVAELCALRRNLGNALRDLGSYAEAHRLDVETAALGEAHLDRDHRELLLLVNSLSTDLRATGDFIGAYRLNEREVPRHRRVLGEKDRLTLSLELDLALDMMLAGEFPEVIALLSRIYDDRRALHGSEEHPAVQVVLNNLVRAIRLGGDYGDAREQNETVYGMVLATRGPDHVRTMRAANDFAIALRLAEGASPDAVAFAEERHARYGSALWARHPDKVAAEILLSNVYREAGKLTEADELLRRAHTRMLAIYDDDHPYVQGVRSNLALLNRLQGEPEEAVALSEHAVASQDARLRGRSFLQVCCAVNLAGDLAAARRLPEAVERGESTLALAVERLGERHPVTLGCRFNLGLDLAATDPERALVLREEATRAMEARLGRQHPRVAAMAAGERMDFDFDPSPI
ncbi:FxSxx-COOH system tetratricopeptide repeat protein [Actinocorallia sp. API 0066]|uniref:FxSxx-COOH system tetratricopeptide repeat protein n=1 Tax=Actinocorallia sp. API 0066 TaxID=2896846 RepID=UPI001E4B1651|nr:FxSxx-COOH system tetratricopeptide repeat protein [Actinocorallia sp. API 0066]MCD0447612.1 FxSxx-COOH system tetratricopeptide repeat protein [Actinocorallia sp. API 0066]